MWFYNSFEELNNEINKIISNYPLVDYYVSYGKVNKKDVGILYGWFINNIFYLDLVFVDENYRKKGIATKMIKDLIKELEKRKCKFIIVKLIIYNGKYLLKNILEKENFKLFSSDDNNKWYVLELDKHLL